MAAGALTAAAAAASGADMEQRSAWLACFVAAACGAASWWLEKRLDAGAVAQRLDAIESADTPAAQGRVIAAFESERTPEPAPMAQLLAARVALALAQRRWRSSLVKVSTWMPALALVCLALAAHVLQSTSTARARLEQAISRTRFVAAAALADTSAASQTQLEVARAALELASRAERLVLDPRGLDRTPAELDSAAKNTAQELTRLLEQARSALESRGAQPDWARQFLDQAERLAAAGQGSASSAMDQFQAPPSSDSRAKTAAKLDPGQGEATMASPPMQEASRTNPVAEQGFGAAQPSASLIAPWWPQRFDAVVRSFAQTTHNAPGPAPSKSPQ